MVVLLLNTQPNNKNNNVFLKLVVQELNRIVNLINAIRLSSHPLIFCSSFTITYHRIYTYILNSSSILLVVFYYTTTLNSSILLQQLKRSYNLNNEI